MLAITRLYWARQTYLIGDSRIPEQLLINAEKWHILEISLKCHLVVDYGEAMAEGRSTEHVAKEGRPSDFS